MENQQHLMRLDLLSNAAVETLSPSFNHLPTTSHKDGKYRLRRYSQIQLGSKSMEILASDTFEQGHDYNDFQGGIKRKFENIENSTIHSDGMKELIFLFKAVNSLPLGTKVDIHQMRVITLNLDTQVSPEGVHRDGYDYISMIGISRYNIAGGHLLVYTDKDSDHFLSIPLCAGQVVTLDDRRLWHNASPIQAIDQQKTGHMDAFILTARL